MPSNSEKGPSQGLGNIAAHTLPGEGLNYCLPEPRRRKAVEDIYLQGQAVCAMLFKIRDFSLHARLHNPEVMESLGRGAWTDLESLAQERFHLAQAPVVERLAQDSFLLLVGASGERSADLERTASVLRLKLRARVRRKSLNLTGQAMDVAVGAAMLPRHPDLGQALDQALDQAQRMAKGVHEPATSPLAKEFRAILETPLVRSVYQPVVDLRGGGVFAWESLSRGPAGSIFESPSMLFDFAEEQGLVFPLERACRQSAIANFPRPAGGGKLFINIHPRTLVDPSFSPGETRRILNQYGMDPHDVVLEITERHSTQEFSLFHRTLDHYRSEGFRVAVDDVGTGYSGLWTIAEIRPDFIKLDMSLVRGIDANPIKRALIETFLTFSDKVGCKIIAEGIETESELSTLVSMGVHYGQGYFLSRPAPPPLPEPAQEVFARISLSNRTVISEFSCASPIGLHCTPIEAFKTKATVGEVKRHLEVCPQEAAVAVVAAGRPTGLVMRHHMDRVLSSQFGLALYSNRAVTKIMDGKPLVFDWNTPVETVAQAASSRESFKLYDHVLVTREGKLAGSVSVQRIMDVLAQSQMEMAKGANPLTGLPGNVAIEREMERRVVCDTSTSFIYADLDNFKVYNDSYGFKAGDAIILLTAKILAWAVRRHGSPQDFLGHVGGDDFLVCTSQEKAERICLGAVRCFRRLAPGFHNDLDRQSGFIEGRDRAGKTGKFPLVSLSLAIVDCKGACSLESVSQRAAQMKKYAKSQAGSVYVRDRRGPESAKAPESSQG